MRKISVSNIWHTFSVNRLMEQSYHPWDYASTNSDLDSAFWLDDLSCQLDKSLFWLLLAVLHFWWCLGLWKKSGLRSYIFSLKSTKIGGLQDGTCPGLGLGLSISFSPPLLVILAKRCKISVQIFVKVPNTTWNLGSFWVGTGHVQILQSYTFGGDSDFDKNLGWKVTSLRPKALKLEDCKMELWGKDGLQTQKTLNRGLKWEKWCKSAPIVIGKINI